jgi:hypothetical protein
MCELLVIHCEKGPTVYSKLWNKNSKKKYTFLLSSELLPPSIPLLADSYSNTVQRCQQQFLLLVFLLSMWLVEVLPTLASGGFERSQFKQQQDALSSLLILFPLYMNIRGRKGYPVVEFLNNLWA